MVEDSESKFIANFWLKTDRPTELVVEAPSRSLKTIKKNLLTEKTFKIYSWGLTQNVLPKNRGFPRIIGLFNLGCLG